MIPLLRIGLPPRETTGSRLLRQFASGFHRELQALETTGSLRSPVRQPTPERASGVGFGASFFDGAWRVGRGSDGERIGLPIAAPGQRIHGNVARTLGIAILSGRYAPGAVLPGEIEFSEHLGISRTAYREAMRILSAKGLVESRPKTGTRVSPRSRWNLLDPDILAWAFEAEPSEAFIRDLFELRQIVEPAAAALAAERRTALDIARMGHALEEMDRFGLAVPEGRAADRAFHHAVLEATRNAPLLSLSSSIAAAVTWTTLYKQRLRVLPRNPMPDHRNLYEAIVAGDPGQAREMMSELIRLALADTEMTMKA